ncbi:MAG: disulfide bond formation protein B [Devosiaceae bacterium]|nr:disulfide bond formation protein B [Devosiaceae bacterium]
MLQKISPFANQNSSPVNTAFVIGFFTIIGAWAFELIGGYEPCQLCLAQRIPYYAGLPIIALLLVFWNKIPPVARMSATLLAAGIFVWSTYLGTSHAGIEWGFWQGPSSCAGNSGSINFADLNALNDARVIPCDTPQFRFLGVSFAGYNALISVLIAYFLLRSAIGQFKTKKL